MHICQKLEGAKCGLATLSQRRLLQPVSSYRAWKATACLKALQRDENESLLRGPLGNSGLPVNYILGNSVAAALQKYAMWPIPE